MPVKMNIHSLPGSQITSGALDAVRHLTFAICEGVLCPESNGEPTNNLFGRPVTSSASGDVSFALGLSATGIRSGIILLPEQIAVNLDPIATAVRWHIPLVVFAGVRDASQIHQLSQTGAVVFSACSVQEAVDLLLMAYRVAEWSLVPAVVCMEASILHTAAILTFPGKEAIASMAGDIDQLIPSATPAQQIIFGKNRKRIPAWFNVDQPVSLGASKQLKEGSYEAAAQQTYFYDHLDGILAEAYEEFHTVTGRRYSDLASNSGQEADYLILSYGQVGGVVTEALEGFRPQPKTKIAAASLVRIHPFPVRAVRPLLARKKALTVLEQAIAATHPATLLKEISCLPEARNIALFSGQYGVVPGPASMTAVIRNMLPEAKGKSVFWIDIDFTHTQSKYPKHQVLLEAIDREYPGARHQSISSSEIANSHASVNPRIPVSIRQYKDIGPSYAKLTRFYHDTASFFLSDPGELVADPFQAVPVMPPSSAVFHAALPDGEEKSWPVFNALACTGCGACFLQCPHAAINPIVIGLENLVKAGITIANANGAKITQLIPLVKNIAKAIPDVIKPKRQNITSVSDFLNEAFETAAQQMKLEGEKRTVAMQDMQAVVMALKDFPVTLTNIFYDSHELIRKGSGELFGLAIDTNACTGCAVCVAVCEEDALTLSTQETDVLTTHQQQYALWEQMPDTAADSIVRLLDEREYNPFAALLLSRHYNQVITGTSRQREEDGSKSVVRLIAAMAEATLQPKVQEAISKMNQLIEGLSSGIRDQLGAALPSDNFEALSKVLSDIKEDRNPLEDVIEKFGTAEYLKLVDTKSLKRKVELAKSLTTLTWLLREGASGTGRARMGFVIDGSMSWSHAYPWNNFTAPVILHLDGTTPELARGMVQGHTRQLLDNIKVLRRAELEINGSYAPDIHDVQIASLTWGDLTPEEKNLVPPILVVGSRSKLSGQHMDALLRMLDTAWPLKAIVLDDAVPGQDGYEADVTGGIGALLPVIAMQSVQVLKSSLAVPQHLFSGLAEIFNSSKPAVAWVFTPSLSKHTLASSAFPRLFALSLDARAFPVFNFNPDREGSLLSAKLSMDGNPQDERTWMQSDLSYTENGTEMTVPYPLSWADWAYTLKSWQERFEPHTDAMGKPVLVAEYVLLPASERPGKSPVVYRINANGELKKYRADETVVRATEACANTWRLLREISGELSAFPEKLEKKVEAALAVTYAQRMEESKREYEQKILTQEQEYLEKIRITIKEKLMRLSASVAK